MVMVLTWRSSIYISFFFVNKRRTHKEFFVYVNNFSFLFFFFIVFCLLVCFGVNLFVTYLFSVQFCFAELCCRIAVSKAIMQ